MAGVIGEGVGERGRREKLGGLGRGKLGFAFSRMLWHNGAVSNQKFKSIGTGLHTM